MYATWFLSNWEPERVQLLKASFTLGMRAKNSNMFLKWRQRVQGTWDVLRSDIC